jgi:antagonist of KipI
MTRLRRRTIHVLKPGFLTTVQDLGRPRYQRFGMPVAGAMDAFACRAANRLVGNPDSAAVLEVTIVGPTLLFEQNAVIALTGGQLSPCLDRVPLPMWTSLVISAGAHVSFGRQVNGARSYLAVAGGFDVPPVLGSRSTHIRSHTGGFHGRALIKDDRLEWGSPPRGAVTRVERSIPKELRPAYAAHPTLRIILGPQTDFFEQEAVAALTTSRYTVSSDSDRMGYRLSGPALTHRSVAEMISDATPIGSLQVPPNRQPILLMADRQTTGGYPKIAVVISADLSVAAQLMPGHTVGFSEVTVAQAHALLREHEALLQEATGRWRNGGVAP